MTALITLWQVSLVLCLLGAIALLALVAARGISERRQRRRAAARAELLPVLIGGGTPSPVRGAAANVAMELTIELAEIMRGTDRDSMLAVAEAMGVPRFLDRRLRSSSAQERLTAAETLALFEQYRHRAETALDDTNPDVRLGAALALAQRGEGMRPTEVVSHLRLGIDEHSLLLVSLMRDLAARDPDDVREMIFDPMLTDDAKLAAIDALAEMGHTHVPLLSYVAQEAQTDPHLQPRIIAALGRTKHPGSVDAIRVALTSPEWKVRAAAAEAAGHAALVDLADRLCELLCDRIWMVRFRAAEALLKFGAIGRERLVAASNGADPLAREAARTMLAEAAAT